MAIHANSTSASSAKRRRLLPRPVPPRSPLLPRPARATPITHADLIALFSGRAEIESAIDRLIDILDAVDAPDEDREDDDPAEHGGDDEPSLGAPENHSRYPDQTWWSQGGDLFCIDLEEVDEDGTEVPDTPPDPHEVACLELAGGVHV